MSNEQRDVPTALREKRAVLAADIEHLRKQIGIKSKQLKTVDAAIKLFDPSFRTASIKAKHSSYRIHLFRRGELVQAVLKALRTADGPLSQTEVCNLVADAVGGTEQARKALPTRIRSSLHYLVRSQKFIRQIGGGRGVRYTLADDVE
jgi:hypothetical protein